MMLVQKSVYMLVILDPGERMDQMRLYSLLTVACKVILKQISKFLHEFGVFFETVFTETCKDLTEQVREIIVILVFYRPQELYRFLRFSGKKCGGDNLRQFGK